jgi:hypothetical protein
MLGWSGVYVKEGTRILFYVLSSEVMSGGGTEIWNLRFTVGPH